MHKDSKLADTLSRLEIGELIPPELYEVVAEILVFVDQMDRIRAKMEQANKKNRDKFREIRMCLERTSYEQKKKRSSSRTGCKSISGKRGVRIQTINYRVRQGEIDIVGYEKGTLVFFEVKYRANAGNGLPQEAVSVAKQRQICRVALFYLNQYHIPEQQPVRYDVIAILGNEITWIRNAFLHQIW